MAKKKNDDDRLPVIVNVACYDSVKHHFKLRSRWKVRGVEKRGKGKNVVILERVTK